MFAGNLIVNLVISLGFSVHGMPSDSWRLGECKPGKLRGMTLGWAQDVPTEFWRAHGVAGFDGCWYTLHGPVSACTVKTTVHTYGKQTISSFTQGWARFCIANALNLGATVIFTKVGPADFEVRKV